MMALHDDGKAHRALAARLAEQARAAERLRRTTEDINRRIWDEARASEDFLRRIRLRWGAQDRAERDAEGAGDDFAE